MTLETIAALVLNAYQLRERYHRTSSREDQQELDAMLLNAMNLLERALRRLEAERAQVKKA